MNLPALPRLPRKSRASRSLAPCLCGCGRLCGQRFAPGHDAKLLAWVLHVEAGHLAEAPAPHTHAVAVELHLRAMAGVSGESHTPVALTREIMSHLAPGEVIWDFDHAAVA
jgi:hypothetical protein